MRMMYRINPKRKENVQLKKMIKLWRENKFALGGIVFKIIREIDGDKRPLPKDLKV